MMRVETRNPHDGMCFESLGEPSAVSGVPVTDQGDSCSTPSKVDLWVAGIEKVMEELVLVSSRYADLGLGDLDIEIFKYGDSVNSALLKAYCDLTLLLDHVEHMREAAVSDV
ncbi:hypothetical protein [Xylella fastidiosa]|uniref:hypothetical protein n=1 Tax=Xylella fastidiosa TaxID=2371 RepID=UPI00090AA4D3|nr:hypothetical protein [Xylella fastidiosa]ALQ96886.1 hypothetical protein XFC3_05350 [Xylella fastidiosa]ALQ96898.1 hypothetical protein XFC3_05415 [Xylella fastidiosa]